ncbi:DUF3892 domain-containing protein [Paenibacillus sp. GD4]|uniref:DUF3892 domain-containing protein n=1 Tax=Paenibacillus sp. GD4 TaxID=3068890 RepID=UPI002796BA3A|nr:DUF3892 domain-containing protein [Paenibacillus sp. GD4]MDQ1909638.1 DUF3892 domain-containing protein [Paenibacillus sp. GD4]
MARRRQGRSYGQGGQFGFQAAQQGPDSGYQNAVEPTHNANFAWNGQPIPTFTPNGNYGGAGMSGGMGIAPGMAQGMSQGMAQGMGQPAYIPQARNNNNGQSFEGGMPVPGSTGNPNAPYGQRNTGINNADDRNVGFQGGYTGYGPNGQPLQYGTFMRDGTQYGAGPHTIDPNKLMVQAVHYENGGIAAVRFQDGSVADVATAIGMAEAGLIEDVNTGRNREGQKTLRSYPDGDPSNNLSNLPRF